MSSLDCRHTTVTVTIPRLTAGDMLVAVLSGADGGQVTLGEFAMEGDGAVEVVGQFGIVIADAHFEPHRCWKRASAC